ncbi:MAG: six-hairpin glycosidase-like protein, partial [Bacteroidia bacterium]|nr:six-hairpin glycosidase-like protein [Bacteroidia bacterium]
AMSHQPSAICDDTNFWHIKPPTSGIQDPGSSIQYSASITWDLTKETRLPHADNIEMNGQQVAGIIYYEIDTNRIPTLRRHLIFPQLQVFIKPGQSKWAKYRAYLKHDYEDDILPVLVSGDKTIKPGQVDSVVINGMLTFYHAPIQGVVIERTLLPSMTERLFVEGWKITNINDSAIEVSIGDCRYDLTQEGFYGTYKQSVSVYPTGTIFLNPGESYQFALFFAAYLNDEPGIVGTFDDFLEEREAFLDTIANNLKLKTPDPVLNTLFYFSKIRAAESIYKTKMGLVHSPGGGRYYTGVWANDQAEYSGPFFPYLGYEIGNIAALNAYRVFAQNIPEGEGNFWSSFEMNGELTCCGGDRGDAAMIAFGASHFALASGDEIIAKELWPLIEWCLDYCDRHKNEEGVIISDSDEMEGRIATGGANLSTSSLYYGALSLAINLGKELGVSGQQLKRYRSQEKELLSAIDAYFGATLEGLDTYQYFNGHTYLRHWICLPLVMGIDKRTEGTLDALFSKLWTDNGVRVEYNPNLTEPDLFWDRGTLYAFRGAFKAGGTERALEKLLAYSQTRLMGDHVPYVVEAWPEGNMAHLSAESALYCRIFTEGLLGINPTGLNSFNITPRLPEDWDGYTLDHIRAFGGDFNIRVCRAGEKVRLRINQGEDILFDKTTQEGGTFRVNL